MQLHFSYMNGPCWRCNWHVCPMACPRHRAHTCKRGQSGELLGHCGVPGAPLRFVMLIAAHTRLMPLSRSIGVGVSEPQLLPTTCRGEQPAAAWTPTDACGSRTVYRRFFFAGALTFPAASIAMSARPAVTAATYSSGCGSMPSCRPPCKMAMQPPTMRYSM